MTRSKIEIFRRTAKKIAALLSIPYWSLGYLMMGLDDEYYHIKLGDAYIELSLFWKAIAHFKKALKEKERAWSHLQLGWALQNSNQVEDALIHFRRGYEMYPTPSLAADLAKTECNFSNYDRAKILADYARKNEDKLDNNDVEKLLEVEKLLSEKACG